MFAIFDAEGTLVGMITLNSAQHTNIIDVLEDADYRGDSWTISGT